MSNILTADMKTFSLGVMKCERVILFFSNNSFTLDKKQFDDRNKPINVDTPKAYLVDNFLDLSDDGIVTNKNPIANPFRE
jgi:hypothetical protein